MTEQVDYLPGHAGVKEDDRVDRLLNFILDMPE